MKLDQINTQINESLFSRIIKFILAAGAVIGSILLIKNVFFKKDLEIETSSDSKDVEFIKAGELKTYDLKLEFSLNDQSERDVVKTADKIMDYFSSRYRSSVEMYGKERKGRIMNIYFPFKSQSEAKRAGSDLEELLQDME